MKRALLVLVAFAAGAGSWAGVVAYWPTGHGPGEHYAPRPDLSKYGTVTPAPLTIVNSEPLPVRKGDLFDEVDAEAKRKLPIQLQIDDLRNRVADLEKAAGKK